MSEAPRGHKHLNLILAVLAVAIAATLAWLAMRPGGLLQGTGGASGGQAGTGAGNDEAADSRSAKGGAKGGAKGNAQNAADQADVPLWGVTITGLFKGDIDYSFDIDGKWVPDPRNPTRSALTEGNGSWLSLAGGSYYSLLKWPVDAAKCPESVRAVSATSAEFRYSGRLHASAYFRSPRRGGEWGTDELQPLNDAARKNLEALRADATLGGVRGVVLGPDRRPLPGALVALGMPAVFDGRMRQLIRAVATEADGTFAFERLVPGRTAINARAAGFRLTRPVPVFVGSAPAAHPVEIVLQPAGIVTGTVNDEAGKPVPLATVSVTLAKPWDEYDEIPSILPEVRTDAAGIYTCASLAPGLYNLTAAAHGMLDATKKDVEVKAGDEPLTVDLMLKSGLALRGRVVRQEGGEKVGVAGATVTASGPVETDDEDGAGTDENEDNEDEDGSPYTILGMHYANAKAISGEDGAFVLTGIVPGAKCTVTASLGLLRTDRHDPVKVLDGVETAPIELQLPAGVRAAGSVVDGAGAPVADAEVTVAMTSTLGRGPEEMPDRDLLGDRFPRAVTGADGRFALENLPPKSVCILEARATGYAPAKSQPVALAAGQDAEIKLLRAATIAGHVTDKATGQPLANARVTLAEGDSSYEYRLGMRFGGGRYHRYHPNFGAMGQFGPYGGLSGEEVLSALTDQSGAYRIEGLAPASYTAQAQGHGDPAADPVQTFTATSKEPVEVAAGATGTIDLQAVATGRVRGHVVKDEDSKPVAMAAVTGQPKPGEDGQEYSYTSIGTSTDSDGAFEILDAEPGKYLLSAHKKGMVTAKDKSKAAPAAADNAAMTLLQKLVPGLGGGEGGEEDPGKEIEVTTGGTIDGVELRLARGGVVRGLVTGPDGQPVPKVAVAVRQGPSQISSDKSGDDGRFEIAGLPTSAKPLTVETTQAAGPDKSWVGKSDPVTLTGAAPEAEVALVLAAGGSVAGRVVDDSGQPVAGARVQCQSVDRTGGFGSYRRYGDGAGKGSPKTNAAGEFVVRGMVEGEYALSASKEGYAADDEAEPAKATVAPHAAVTGVTVTLVKAAGIAYKGRLVTAAGAPAAGWSVTFSGQATAHSNKEVETDADGAFTIQVPGGVQGRLDFNLTGFGQEYGALCYMRARSGNFETPAEPAEEPVTFMIGADHTVKGRVVEAGSRKPLANVQLEVQTYSGVQPEGTACTVNDYESAGKTDADGRFALKGVPAGTLTVRMGGEDDAKGAEKEVDIASDAGAVVDVGDLEMRQPRTVSGRLIDAATGEPYHSPNRWDSIDVRVHDVAEDEDNETRTNVGPGGTFKLTDVKGDEVALTFEIDGYLPLEVPAKKIEPAGDTPLGDLRLERGRSMVGTLVFAKDGQPIKEGVDFYVSVVFKKEKGKDKDEDEDENASGDTNTRSLSAKVKGDAGGFEVRGVGDDPTSAVVHVTGFKDRKFADLPAPDASGRIDLGRIELATGGMIAGTVVDWDNQSVPRAMVRIQLMSDDPKAPHRYRSGDTAWCEEDGTFRFSGLDEGKYRLVASGSQRGGVSKPVEIAVIADADPAEAKLQLEKGGTLRGTLVDLNARPLAEWSVQTRQAGKPSQEDDDPYSGYSPGASTSTNYRGNFSVQVQTTSAFRAVFYYNRETASGSRTMEFRTGPLELSDKEQAFVVPLGPEIAGRVVNEQGEGVAGVGVRVHQEVNEEDDAKRTDAAVGLKELTLEAKAATDSSGRFRIGPVAVGKAEVLFTSDATVDRKVENVIIGLDPATDMGDVAVQAGGTVTGRFVVKKTGTPLNLEDPIDDEEVKVLREGGDTKATARLSVRRGDSAFRITGVPIDATALGVPVQDYVPAEIQGFQVAVGQETAVGDVALEKGATLRVRMIDAGTGLPFDSPEHKVHCLEAKGTFGAANTEWKSSCCPSKGVFIFRAVPPAIQSVTIGNDVTEPVTINSIPAPNDKGIIDLGDRQIRRKTGTPADDTSGN